MLTVITDDITGAAEIAGIGFRLGLRTQLLTGVEQPLPDCDILVVATDTRSMTEEEAVEETRRVVSSLRQAGARTFFKKTDSALRGHVVAELRALLGATTYTNALYLPENPSKGRIVRDGVYYIGGTPLHETSFAWDPEFPATTAVVADRLPGIQPYIANAESEEDIMRQLSALNDEETLLAGAADLFTAYLKMRYADRIACQAEPSRFAGLSSGKALIVCGSTLSTSLADQSYIRQHAIPVGQMPEDVFEGDADASSWLPHLEEVYRQSHSMVLTIGYPSKGGKEFALRLRTVLAEVAGALIAEECPEELVVEGGATAFTLLKQLGWNRFLLTDEVAPGVVRMQRADIHSVHVTLKPGSYPWGKLFG